MADGGIPAASSRGFCEFGVVPIRPQGPVLDLTTPGQGGIVQSVIADYEAPPVIYSPSGKCLGSPMLTVHLAVTRDIAGATDDLRDLSVRLTWGGGRGTGAGDRQVIDADVGRGTAFSFGATHLSLGLVYPDRAGAVVQPNLTARASVEIGTRPSLGLTASVRRTVRLGTILANGGVSAVVGIPLKAKTAVVKSPAVANATFLMREFTAQGAAVIVNEVDLGKLVTDAADVSDAAQFFLLVNAGAEVANVAAMFHLEL
jgi:hypothetical protein